MSIVSVKVPNVLVVEDEMVLRMRAVDIVEDAGFCPVEAVNADEALSILESRSDISLLFTEPLGNLMLAGSAVWMAMGVLVMKKMINFDF